MRYFVYKHSRHEFSSKQNLMEHTYLHSGQKPFRCSACPESFRQASQLSLHKRIDLPQLETCANKVLPQFSDFLTSFATLIRADDLARVSTGLAEELSFLITHNH
jgi:hypothetical protein